jgi:hypothetical protein
MRKRTKKQLKKMVFWIVIVLIIVGVVNVASLLFTDSKPVDDNNNNTNPNQNNTKPPPSPDDIDPRIRSQIEREVRNRLITEEPSIIRVVNITAISDILYKLDIVVIFRYLQNRINFTCNFNIESSTFSGLPDNVFDRTRN